MCINWKKKKIRIVCVITWFTSFSYSHLKKKSIIHSFINVNKLITQLIQWRANNWSRFMLFVCVSVCFMLRVRFIAGTWRGGEWTASLVFTVMIIAANGLCLKGKLNTMKAVEIVEARAGRFQRDYEWS